MVHATLADALASSSDPEMRLLIAAILRDDPDALAALRRIDGMLVSRLLRDLRTPPPHPPSCLPGRPRLRLVHSAR